MGTGETAEPAPPTRRRPGPLALVVVLYGALASLAYLPSFPGNTNRLPTCACGDLIQAAWSLRWTPFALAHGHNPFFTNFVGYPSGANLAQSTTMPLLGVVGAPISVGLGPVAALNFFLWLAIAASATSCFFVLRRWVRCTPAAFVGGLVYGFSPYMAGQAAGHLNLLFVPFPPLILLALDELIVRQRGSALRWGLLLGALGAAQFLVSSEIFVTTGLLALVGVVVLAVANPRQVARHARHAARGLAWALALCTPIVIYPALFNLAGTNRYVGSAHGIYPFPADLLGLVVPNANQWLAPSGIASYANRFIMGDVVENGSYLGIPLLIVLVAVVVLMRRSGLVRFAGIMAAIAWVLSLGPRLTVGTHETAVRLPFVILAHLPIFPSLINARFSLFVDLFGALLLAVGLDRAHTALREGVNPRRRQPAAGLAALGLIVVVALLPLVPNWPRPEYPVSVPSFFTSHEVQRVPAGSVVLTYPYPNVPNVQAMLWQATASMPFRIVGGYQVVPGPDKKASFNLFPPDLTMVPATLVADFLGGAPSDVIANAPTASPKDVRAFLVRYQISTVIQQWGGARPQAALTLFTQALRSPPTRVGSLYVWFHVQDDLASAH
jgi:hypothetical protein